MSDPSQAPANNAGAAPNGSTKTSSPKRRVATSSVDGAVGIIKFSPAFNNQTVRIDVTKIPGAEKLSGMPASLLAYGALSVMQNAYNNSKDPPAAAAAMAQKLLAGNWMPGRAFAEAQPDELLEALSRHLQKPIEHVEQHFLPAYAARHKLASTAAARRKLRTHADIAPLIAQITAERAKEIAARVKGRPTEALDI